MSIITVYQKLAMATSSTMETYIKHEIHNIVGSLGFYTLDEIVEDICLTQRQDVIEENEDQDKLNPFAIFEKMHGDFTAAPEQTDQNEKFFFTKEEIKPHVLKVLVSMAERNVVDCGIYEGRQVWTKTDYFRDDLLDFHKKLRQRLERKELQLGRSVWPF